MITITNGAQTLTVTKGAYTSMYAPQGWTIENHNSEIIRDEFSGTVEMDSKTIQDEEGHAPELKPDDPKDESDDELDLSEIPLSEMTISQLKTYAAQLGLKVNTESARQLRTQIKKTLEG